MERLAAMPGVESVGVVNELPLDEGSNRGRFATERTEATGGAAPLIPYTHAGGDCFRTMGIRLVSGRFFELGDHATGMANTIVSRSAAQAPVAW